MVGGDATDCCGAVAAAQQRAGVGGVLRSCAPAVAKTQRAPWLAEAWVSAGAGLLERRNKTGGPESSFNPRGWDGRGLLGRSRRQRGSGLKSSFGDPHLGFDVLQGSGYGEQALRDARFLGIVNRVCPQRHRHRRSLISRRIVKLTVDHNGDRDETRPSGRRQHHQPDRARTFVYLGGSRHLRDGDLR